MLESTGIKEKLSFRETKQNHLLASSNGGNVADETPLSETAAAPEKKKNKENVNKRKRGQPKKFISAEPKQKTGVAGCGSEAGILGIRSGNVSSEWAGTRSFGFNRIK